MARNRVGIRGFLFKDVGEVSKRHKIIPFKDYEQCTNRNGYEVDYIRLVDLQLICMNELSSSAFRLYIMMKSYANGNVEFTFPHRIFKSFLSNQTFIKARKELVDYGYIEPFVSSANLRIENKYRFSSKWRERNSEVIKRLVGGRGKSKDGG